MKHQMMLPEQMRRVSEVVEFRRRFPCQQLHEQWLLTAEAMMEILSDPRKGQWPVKYTDWN
jgi:hypothetical protein